MRISIVMVLNVHSTQKKGFSMIWKIHGTILQQFVGWFVYPKTQFSSTRYPSLRIKCASHAVNNEKRIIKFDIHCVWITICIQYVYIAYKNVPTTTYTSMQKLHQNIIFRTTKNFQFSIM